MIMKGMIIRSVYLVHVLELSFFSKGILWSLSQYSWDYPKWKLFVHIFHVLFGQVNWPCYWAHHDSVPGLSCLNPTRQQKSGKDRLNPTWKIFQMSSFRLRRTQWTRHIFTLFPFHFENPEGHLCVMVVILGDIQPVQVATQVYI